MILKVESSTDDDTWTTRLQSPRPIDTRMAQPVFIKLKQTRSCQKAHLASACATNISHDKLRRILQARTAPEINSLGLRPARILFDLTRCNASYPPKLPPFSSAYYCIMLRDKMFRITNNAQSHWNAKHGVYFALLLKERTHFRMSMLNISKAQAEP